MKISWRLFLCLTAILGLTLLPAAFLTRHLYLRLPLLLIQAVVLAAALIVAAREIISRPLSRTAEDMRQLRLGRAGESVTPLPADVFGPLSKEVSHLTGSLLAARESAEKEAKLRYFGESVWTPERLRTHVRSTLKERPLFVVSNREPYEHRLKGKQVEWMIPPSGLVTALEPILRACGGLWVAQGTGDADRQTVDEHDHVRVPPDEPQYMLRRVWVSEEEEEGFYYGFANEGLWPLCHIAHTRPLFRPEDWARYLAVNQKFADAVLEEMQTTEDPYVLVQDYHFALLPQMIKEKRPDARVALFWHIPWPNPESFGICPWRRELLQGMLGADLLGFHIQQHCNNFLDTVDRTLESRIDWERFAVQRQGHSTWVKPFPISVAFAPLSSKASPLPPTLHKEDFLKKLGIKATYLGVGVDRLDYTKGLVERLRGIEKFLELNPAFIGEFAFVELAAPSRTLIPRYRELMAEVEAEAARINQRFRDKEWRPIIILQKQHSHEDIEPFYQLADVCMVTSLHDGMNLVAKEFVAARHDESGVLILSPFTGAARELRDALIANPYDVEQLAKTLQQALVMPKEERKARMRHMRETVREHNIYRWGANLISELSHIRLPAPTSAPLTPAASNVFAQSL